MPYQEVVERLWTGARWLEGPVWFGDRGELLVSDIPNDRILRWTDADGAVTEYRAPPTTRTATPATARAGSSRASTSPDRVTRTEYDGSVTVLLDRFEGGRLKPRTTWSRAVTAPSGSRIPHGA